MAMMHVHGTCPCSLSMLPFHVHAVTPCPCYMSCTMSMSPCCMSVLHVNSAYFCYISSTCLRCMSVVACPQCMSILHVHASYDVACAWLYFACPCYISTLHVHAAFPLHVHAEFPLHVGFSGKNKFKQCVARLATKRG